MVTGCFEIYGGNYACLYHGSQVPSLFEWGIKRLWVIDSGLFVTVSTEVFWLYLLSFDYFFLNPFSPSQEQMDQSGQTWRKWPSMDALNIYCWGTHKNLDGQPRPWFAEEIRFWTFRFWLVKLNLFYLNFSLSSIWTARNCVAYILKPELISEKKNGEDNSNCLNSWTCFFCCRNRNKSELRYEQSQESWWLRMVHLLC